jgi:hypothetical protein
MENTSLECEVKKTNLKGSLTQKEVKLESRESPATWMHSMSAWALEGFAGGNPAAILFTIYDSDQFGPAPAVGPQSGCSNIESQDAGDPFANAPSLTMVNGAAITAASSTPVGAGAVVSHVLGYAQTLAEAQVAMANVEGDTCFYQAQVEQSGGEEIEVEGDPGAPPPEGPPEVTGG